MNEDPHRWVLLALPSSGFGHIIRLSCGVRETCFDIYERAAALRRTALPSGKVILLNPLPQQENQ